MHESEAIMNHNGTRERTLTLESGPKQSNQYEKDNICDKL